MSNENKINLYLISQTVNNDYDTYDSAVVAAKSEEEAKSIHPGGDYYSHDEWCAKKYVKVKFIGIATENISGVVCSSYNAG